MKKPILLALLFWMLFLTKTWSRQMGSEQDSSAKLYPHISLGYGQKHSFLGSINLELDNGLNAAFFFNVHNRLSTKNPADYIDPNVAWKSSTRFWERLSCRGGTLGKSIEIPGVKMRVNVKAGTGKGRFVEPIDFEATPPSGGYDFWSGQEEEYFPGRYTVVYARRKGFRVYTYEANCSLPISKYLGLSVGVFGNSNKYWKLFGVSASAQFGWMKDPLLK